MTSFDASELQPYEKKTIESLAGGNDAIMEIFSLLAKKQRHSMKMRNRAHLATAGLHTLNAYGPVVLPICLTKALGARLEDVDGNSYIDCHMGFGASILGHNPVCVVEALSRNLGNGVGGGNFSDDQVALAELIVRFVPNLERVTFLHSGGEAVEAMVRLARASTGKILIAKFEGCYHGAREIGVYNPWMAFTGIIPTDPQNQINARIATGGFSSTSKFDYLILPYNSELSIEIISQKKHELAAVVIDPVPPFMMDYVEDALNFMKKVSSACDTNGVALLLDEVVTGFRLSKGGAQEAAGVNAQLVAYGKMIAGLGIPISVVAGECGLMESIVTEGSKLDQDKSKAWISSTHAGNSIAVRAALAQLEYLSANYEGIMNLMDRNHATLALEVNNISKEIGIPLRLHGHSRLQSMLTFDGRAAPGESLDYRSIMHRRKPENLKLALLLSFYLRKNGVYCTNLPTMTMSAEHGVEELEIIVAAIRTSLQEMTKAGVFNKFA